MILSINGFVAVEPIAANVAETERKGGMTVLAHKVSVIAAKVVYNFPELGIEAGDTVYLNGDSISKMDWYKKVYEIGERKFILVPKDIVWLVERA